MQFHTHIFLLAMLPAVIIGYHLLNRLHARAGMLFLTGASLVFYAHAGIPEIVCLAVSMAVNYLFVILLRQKRLPGRILLGAGIAFNVLLLLYFKYLNFICSALYGAAGKEFTPRNILLPVGISFFTFQQIAYLADTFRGETDRYSFLDYVLYVVYFPKILMGPITGPADLIPQFHGKKNKKFAPERLIRGIQIFNAGLFKKVLIADTFAKAVGWGFENWKTATSADLMLVMFAYSFQIYFDFSGYSDMAAGVSEMLHITLPMNFDSPYKACSIRDFWKRWHISLTKFLTKYIYIPLGGNRKGKARTYLHIMAVFLISGLWHGANWTFILWGALHGTFSIFDRLTEKVRSHVHPAMQWMASFLTVSILWFLFRAESIAQWLGMLRTIFCFQNTGVSDGLIRAFAVPESNVLIHYTHTSLLNSAVRGFPMLVFYLVSVIMCLCFENAYRKKYRVTVFSAVLCACLFVFCLTCIGGESVFVYFDF